MSATKQVCLTSFLRPDFVKSLTPKTILRSNEECKKKKKIVISKGIPEKETLRFYQ